MHRKKLLHLSLLLILVFSTGQAALAQRKKTVRGVSGSSVAERSNSRALTPDAQRRLDTFLKVWQVINDHYFDPTFNNLNWTTIKGQYEPIVRNVKTDAELHKILHEMINRLGRSHLAIIPPEVYQAIEKAKREAKARENKSGDVSSATEGEGEEESSYDESLAQYGIGVDLRLMNGQFVITRIDKDAAATNAGLNAGFVIEKINDVSLADMIHRIGIYYADSRNIMRQLPNEIVAYFLNGEKDSAVEVTYLDGTDQRKLIKIQRELIKSETISIGKNFPDQQLRFETASLNEDVGYIRFNQFAIPVIEKLCSSLNEFKDKKALIIDLRGNTGGVIASLVGLGGMLTETTVDLGTSIYKTGEEKLVATSKAKNFKGRLVFLVDDTTASAAEMFAVSFQESGGALVVGEKTAGASLPSIVIELPTGAVMQYPIANYRSGKGTFLEGNGVTPNFTVALDRKSLTAGKDAQLNKALSLIKENNAFPGVDNVRKFKAPIAAAPPPPPPPKRMPNPLEIKGKVLAEVTMKAPAPPPMAKEEAPVKDAASVKIIDDFIAGIGGRERFEKVRSYVMTGKAQLQLRGSVHDMEYGVYRTAPDKYAEIMMSPSGGEIREVFNGKNYFAQADYGFVRDLPLSADTADLELLSPITALLKTDLFVSLKHLGSYERDGRKVNLIDAKTKHGASVALAFDVETKMLSYFTGNYYGLIFGDYRKVGDLTLPFRIERENMMRLQFDNIKLNVPVDDSKFAKKINCYDIPN